MEKNKMLNDKIYVLAWKNDGDSRLDIVGVASSYDRIVEMKNTVESQSNWGVENLVIMEYCNGVLPWFYNK